MAAAVANTVDSGEKTYLLLGPIGTGAFGNDVEAIAEVFRKVLDEPMMNSKGPIRYAFGHIWFVSTDKWKNDIFEKVLPNNKSDNVAAVSDIPQSEDVTISPVGDTASPAEDMDVSAGKSHL
jgi:hypothetical protein